MYMLLEVLKSTPMSPTAFNPSHMSRLTDSDRSMLYQQTRPMAPSGQTSPGHCLSLATRGVAVERRIAMERSRVRVSAGHSGVKTLGKFLTPMVSP